jgi:hypothetical protein
MTIYRAGDLVVLKKCPNLFGVGILLNIVPQGHAPTLYRVLFGDSVSICYGEDIRKVTHESR